MDTSTSHFIYFLAVIGGITFTILVSKLLWNIIKILLPQKNYLMRYGESTWAIITDISNPLGIGFCEQLAKLGFNICIISNNQQQITTILNTIKQQTNNNISTDYLLTDFYLSTTSQYFIQIFEHLDSKGILSNLSILVNNVSICNNGYLHELSDQKLINEITVNCVSCVLMSSYAIPYMLKRQKRGAIINISSIVSEHAVPYFATYSATKSFIDGFSQALSLQYENQIDVLCLKPISITQNHGQQQPISILPITKNQCALSAIRKLGFNYQTNGYWTHQLLSFILSILPKTLLRTILESQSKKIVKTESETKINQ